MHAEWRCLCFLSVFIVLFEWNECQIVKQHTDSNLNNAFRHQHARIHECKHMISMKRTCCRCCMRWELKEKKTLSMELSEFPKFQIFNRHTDRRNREICMSENVEIATKNSTKINAFDSKICWLFDVYLVSDNNNIEGKNK